MKDDLNDSPSGFLIDCEGSRKCDLTTDNTNAMEINCKTSTDCKVVSTDSKNNL